MSYRGPSVIGFDASVNGIQPYFITNGFIEAYGPNSAGKLQIIKQNGAYALLVDTTNNLITVGSTVLPSIADLYDLGSPSLHFRNVYADNIHLSTLTPNQVVITDSTGAFTSSTTIPFNLTLSF